jgi:dihydrofolate synthase / folylpolyglutamate synthase
MTFQETLDFLYAQLPVFHRVGASAYKKDLTRTLALLDYLGNPHQAFKTIHIAGTNGKGSSSHMLASILQESSYKTGLYTSPHIKDFGERIKINGQFIDETFVVRFVERINHLLPEIEPSFFELTVAMAFQYFAENKVAIAVIETGLGGRLDSTNVITPIVSLITNISYDHVDLLGDTLPKIAFEKAGIIKSNVPIVISERQAEVELVFLEKAFETNSLLTFASDHYKVEKIGYQNGKMHCQVLLANNSSFEIISGLVGNYQLKNLGGVLQTVDVLKSNGTNIPKSAIKKGIEKVLENTGLKGRWQAIGRHPLTICDIAHNEAGIQTLLVTVQSFQPTRLHIVFGVVKDKDLNKVLSILPKEASYYFSNAHSPRAMSVQELKEKAQQFGLIGNAFDDVNEAIASARLTANTEDLVLVCGSSFLVAEVEGV